MKMMGYTNMVGRYNSARSAAAYLDMESEVVICIILLCQLQSMQCFNVIYFALLLA